MITDNKLKLPFYAKTSILLIGSFAFFTLLFLAKSIIVPLVFATILAILLSPVVNFFVRIKLNRTIAVSVTILLTLMIIVTLSSLLISEISGFSELWPVLVEKFTAILNKTITEGADYFNRDPQKIHEWISRIQGEILTAGTSSIGHTLETIGGGVLTLFLLPVYIFLLLFYRPLLLEFIHRLFGSDNHSKVAQIVTEVKTVIQRYLFGLVIEAVIVAALNITVLLILGIEYAVVLGIIGALLNVIPYIGGIIAVALAMLVAFVINGSPVYAFYVLVAYLIIQIIDNNFIVPYIVASKVRINALFSIMGVIAGNALWGVPGMFLAIPVLAILKVIFDRIESLNAWGFLLGDKMPPIIKLTGIFKKLKTRSK